MFREMRRKDRKLDHAQAIQILEEGEYGILSLWDENGYPYGVPLNYIMLDKEIYFHSAKKGQKIDCIVYNEKVSFSVVSKAIIKAKDFATDFSSVIVFGRAMEVDGEEKQKALQEFINKFSPNYLEEGKAYIEREKSNAKVIKIQTQHITGKARKT